MKQNPMNIWKAKTKQSKQEDRCGDKNQNLTQNHCQQQQQQQMKIKMSRQGHLDRKQFHFKQRVLSEQDKLHRKTKTMILAF